jgi:hypothetical protein
MKSFILSICFSFITLLSNIKDSDLKDITKPYLGEYLCKSAQLGAKDCLEGFSYIRLELKDQETFILHYKEKQGEKKEVKGKYVYNKESGCLQFVDKSGVFKREFPLNNGVLTISFSIGEKNLIMQSEQN